MSKVLALIPARGGSKRIPGKNIRAFHGKPIIQYSIDAALESGVFDEVMVSTEDESIASLARELGAAVPFLRGLETSSDIAGLADVIDEVLQEYKKRGEEFDVVCCLLATAPFLRGDQLLRAYATLDTFSADAVVSVVRSSYPVEQALHIVDGCIVVANKDAFAKRTQDCAESFFDAGLFYFVRVANFFETRSLFPKNTIPFFVGELESQDIDTLDDWRSAELKYKLTVLEQQI